MFGAAPPSNLIASHVHGNKPELPPDIELRRIRALFRPHRLELAVVIACLAAVAVLGLVPAIAVRAIVDQAFEKHRLDTLMLGVAMMSLGAVVSTILNVYQGRLASIVAESVLLDLRQKLLRALYETPISFFSARRTGEIVSRVITDPNSVCNLITITLASIVTNVFIMLTSLVTMVVLDWKLSLVALAALPVMVLPLKSLGRRVYPVRKEAMEMRDHVHAFVEETVSMRGVALIKSFGRQDIEVDRSYNMGKDLLDAEVRMETVWRWFTGAVNALAILGPAAVWLVGGYLFFSGAESIGTIVAFVALLSRIYSPASALAGVEAQLLSATAVFERIFEYLDLLPEDRLGRGGVKLAHIEGRISLERVDFAYAKGRPALERITFDVEPGACIGIVGTSGSGKTTLANLVLRFFDPDSGTIRVDDIDLREWDLKTYRSFVGVVQQETLLCHDSVANNIRYGRVAATDDEVVAAAKAANIHETITRFPEKYETIVGEGGHRMSGGERQRIAIARALLRDPRILILDEATSSLDAENERLVQVGLQRLMQGRTSLVIAHRLSTLANADKIVILERGRIVDCGTQAELLLRSSHYARLYSMSLPYVAATGTE